MSIRAPLFLALCVVTHFTEPISSVVRNHLPYQLSVDSQNVHVIWSQGHCVTNEF